MEYFGEFVALFGLTGALVLGAMVYLAKVIISKMSATELAAHQASLEAANAVHQANLDAANNRALEELRARLRKGDYAAQSLQERRDRLIPELHSAFEQVNSHVTSLLGIWENQIVFSEYTSKEPPLPFVEQVASTLKAMISKREQKVDDLLRLLNDATLCFPETFITQFKEKADLTLFGIIGIEGGCVFQAESPEARHDVISEKVDQARKWRDLTAKHYKEIVLPQFRTWLGVEQMDSDNSP